MIVENIKYFYDNYDFEMLMSWIDRADINVLFNPFVLGPILLIVGLLAYPKTTAIGQKLAVAVPAAGYLFVTGVILKNDVISNIGPFILAMGAFFMIIGYIIYSQLLSN